MQPSIVRTELRKRTPLHFLVDDLQVWATYLDAKNNGQFGVRFIWMEDKYSSSPLHHITQDDGHSFHQFESYLMLHTGGLDMHITVQESAPEKLHRLNRIWAEYRRKLKEQPSTGV
jgi:hypothetical protein